MPLTGDVTSAEIEARLARVADRYLRGVAISTIASDEKVSSTMIAHLLARCRERWKEQAIEAIDERIALELAKIDALEREYWAGWARSQHDAVTTEQIRETEDGAIVPSAPAVPGGEPFTRLPTRTRVHARAVKKGQVGNVVYLQGVQWCIKTRCDLLGITQAGGGPVPAGERVVVGSLDEASPEQRTSRLLAIVETIRKRAEQGLAD